MIDADVIATLTQFGAAGLIGWMWLVERRASAERDRQIAEAHARLMDERREMDVLIAAINENTRALTAIDAGQNRLIAFVECLGGRRDTAERGRDESDRTVA